MSARGRTAIAIGVVVVVWLAAPAPAYAGLCQTLLDCFLSPATEKALKFILAAALMYGLALTLPVLAAMIAEAAAPYIAGLIGAGEDGLIGDLPEIGDPFEPVDPEPGGPGLTPKGGPGAGVSWPNQWPDFNPANSRTNCGAISDAVDRWLGGRQFETVPDGPADYPFLLDPKTANWTSVAGPSTIEKGLLSAGDGARGIVWVDNGNGISHVFNVVNEGGQVIAIDGQTGAIGSVGDVAGFSNYGGPNTGWRFYRTNPFGG